VDGNAPSNAWIDNHWAPRGWSVTNWCFLSRCAGNPVVYENDTELMSENEVEFRVEATKVPFPNAIQFPNGRSDLVSSERALPWAQVQECIPSFFTTPTSKHLLR
jgi:hypothetical protein